MMGTNYSTVDHLKGVGNNPALGQGFQDLLPEPRESPAPELSVDTRSLPKFLRPVSQWSICTCNPENAIKNKAVIGRSAPIRGTDRKDKPFKERPLLVRH